MKKRLLCALLCLCLAAYAAPYACAQDAAGYVALGDSITAGYGLAEESPCFAELVARQNGLSLANHAVNGLTSAGLLAQLQDPDGALCGDVAAADVVTVTIGGNDLLDALYGYLAAAYNAQNGTELSGSDLQAKLMGGDPGAIMFAAGKVAGFVESTQADAALDVFASNLEQILGLIHTLNPDALVVVCNQYNPYTHIGSAGALLTQAFDGGVARLNPVITAVGERCGAVVADVCTVLGSADENPCNAVFDPAAAVNLDVHPNAYGHSLIADVVNRMLSVWDLAAQQGDGLDPGRAMTRAALVQLLFDLDGQPAADAAQAGFSDVAADAPYAESVGWAYDAGIVNGTGGGLFSPDDTVTREQLCAMLYRYAQYKGYDVSVGEDTNILSYADFAQVGEYAIPAMQWACGAGVLSGTETGMLNPQDTVSYAQAVQMLAASGGRQTAFGGR